MNVNLLKSALTQALTQALVEEATESKGGHFSII